MNMLRTVLMVMIIVIMAAIGSWFGNKIIRQHSGSGASSEVPNLPTEEEIIRRFEREAESQNQRGPVMVDEITRLDNTSVGPGFRITYHYTLVGFGSKDVSPTVFRSEMQARLVSQVCSRDDLEQYIARGATYAYEYLGSDGVRIDMLEIDSTDCENLSVEAN